MGSVLQNSIYSSINSAFSFIARMHRSINQELEMEADFFILTPNDPFPEFSISATLGSVGLEVLVPIRKMLLP